MSPVVAQTWLKLHGQGGQLCQGYSDVDLLGDGQRVVDFYFQVSHGALYFLMAEK